MQRENVGAELEKNETKATDSSNPLIMNPFKPNAAGEQLRSLILLVALLAVILTSSRSSSHPVIEILAGPFYTAVFCIAGYLIGARRRWLTTYLTLAIPAFIFGLALEFFEVPSSLEIINAFLSLGLQVLMIFLVFRFSLLETGATSLDRTFAGICGYLILALLWANLYQIHELLAPGGFHGAHGQPVAPNDGSLLYFSLVTLSTLGYGDISPVTPQTRIFSALEAVTGTLYLAVFVSSLVAGLRREPS